MGDGEVCVLLVVRQMMVMGDGEVCVGDEIG